MTKTKQWIFLSKYSFIQVINNCSNETCAVVQPHIFGKEKVHFMAFPNVWRKLSVTYHQTFKISLVVESE